MNLWHVLSLIAALLGAGLFWWANHEDPPPKPEAGIEVPDPSVIPNARGEQERPLRFGP